MESRPHGEEEDMEFAELEGPKFVSPDEEVKSGEQPESLTRKDEFALWLKYLDNEKPQLSSKKAYNMLNRSTIEVALCP
jgi:hypothetical protein